MYHETGPTSAMWVEAMKRNLSGPVIVSESHPVMAELQLERELVCSCNPSRSRVLEEHARLARLLLRGPELDAVLSRLRRHGYAGSP